MHTSPPLAPAIRLKTAEFRECAGRAGLTTESTIADRLGMHRVSVWRVLTEQNPPGASFVAAALDAFPGSRFEDFFEVTRDMAGRRRAA